MRADGSLPATGPDIHWEVYESALAARRQEIEARRGTLPPEEPETLNRLWTPGFRRPLCALRFFSRTPDSPPVYGARLFPNAPDGPEALFGVMAYRAEREVVTSLGGRLTELGLQELGGEKTPLNLQERPDSRVGSQALVLAPGGPDSNDVEAALIRAFEVPGAVSLGELTPDGHGRLKVASEFALPAEITWDGRGHRVSLDFTVKAPANGRKNFDTWLLGVLNLTNGRPAQHYEDEAAAVIRLEEVLFADRRSIRIILDGGTTQTLPLEPDRLFFKKLVLLLTQTAGGFFERRYFLGSRDGVVSLAQITPSGATVAPGVETAMTGAPGSRRRVTTVASGAAPYRTAYEEREAPGGPAGAFELDRLVISSPDGARELMRIEFNTGTGRGLRDLAYSSEYEQSGRFKIKVGGQNGFAYGDFTVSATQALEPRSPAPGPLYYTSVTLSPRHPADMRAKVIVLHVVSGPDGVYAETQVVPEKLVFSPEFGLKEARERWLPFLE